MKAMLAAFSLALGMPAMAALPVGAKAPNFTAPATLGGKRFTFALAEALKKGPVTLYFYPAAFTSGCTVEAHDFAVATPQFAKAGATVIGVSADDIATLDRFSVAECRSAFPVAAADPALIRAYDVKLPVFSRSNRTTYVIAPGGRIIHAYTALGPAQHVAGALKAVRDWRVAQPQR